MLSWLEVVGFVTGAASVWLFVRQNLWAWTVGLANSGSWFLLFWSSRLYLDAGLQLVYLALGAAGWYWWLHGGPTRTALQVRRTSRGETIALASAGLAGTASLWWVMTLAGDASPLADAATTVTSLIAQFMLTRKLLGTWWCWIAVDIAYLILYSVQHLYLTAALQPLFIVMCVVGLRRWRASLTVPVPSPAAAAVVTP